MYPNGPCPQFLFLCSSPLAPFLGKSFHSTNNKNNVQCTHFTLFLGAEKFFARCLRNGMHLCWLTITVFALLNRLPAMACTWEWASGSAWGSFCGAVSAFHNIPIRASSLHFSMCFLRTYVGTRELAWRLLGSKVLRRLSSANGFSFPFDVICRATAMQNDEKHGPDEPCVRELPSILPKKDTSGKYSLHSQ